MGKKSKIKKSKQEGSQEISQGATKFHRFATLAKFRKAAKFRNPYEFDNAFTSCSSSTFAFFNALQL